MVRVSRVRYITASVIVLGLMTVATPAFAQTGQVRGKVVDTDAKAIEGAAITVAAKETQRKFTTKTNRSGDYIQIGLGPGAYTVTAEKDGMTMTYDATVRLSGPATINFQLVPGMRGTGQLSPEAAKQQGALKAALDGAVAASTAGDHDGAIAKFTEALALKPDCFNCQYGIGYELAQKKDYEKAEAALKKTIEMNPNLGEAHATLATVYNAQKRFDEAAKAGEEAARLSGGAAGGGGSPDAMYNQGVILWNGGKIPEAKKLFEQVVAANPGHADAHYQLGMANLNEGKMPEAAAAFEKYLSLAPTGQYAAQAKGILDQIKKH